MAKELGLNPRSLIKNIPSPEQRWKLPVKQWIRTLYDTKTGITCVRKRPVTRYDTDPVAPGRCTDDLGQTERNDKLPRATMEEWEEYVHEMPADHYPGTQ